MLWIDFVVFNLMLFYLVMKLQLPRIMACSYYYIILVKYLLYKFLLVTREMTLVKFSLFFILYFDEELFILHGLRTGIIKYFCNTEKTSLSHPLSLQDGNCDTEAICPKIKICKWKSTSVFKLLLSSLSTVALYFNFWNNTTCTHRLWHVMYLLM